MTLIHSYTQAVTFKLLVELLDILNKMQVRNCASMYTNEDFRMEKCYY